MGHTTVRAALVNFFKDTPNLFDLYKDAPSYWTWPTANDPQARPNSKFVDPTNPWGAQGFIHIDRSQDTRITLPAYTGNKVTDYTVSFVFWYEYINPDFADPAHRLDSWVDGLDIMVDSIKDKIRSNLNAGDANVIFQIGEGAVGGGSLDIVYEQDLPVQDDSLGIVYMLCRIEFHVIEMLIA